MARTASREAMSLAFRRATDPGGYSLLELIIALAIMSLLGAFVLPSVLKIAQRTQFSLDRQDVERQLDQLPQSASALGRNLVLTSTLQDPSADGTASSPSLVPLPFSSLAPPSSPPQSQSSSPLLSPSSTSLTFSSLPTLPTPLPFSSLTSPPSPVVATAVPKDPYPVTLPEGWNIVVDKPIRYRYDGTCSGGTLRLIAPGAEQKYLMKPPLCELRPG